MTNLFPWPIERDKAPCSWQGSLIDYSLTVIVSSREKKILRIWRRYEEVRRHLRFGKTAHVVLQS